MLKRSNFAFAAVACGLFLAGGPAAAADVTIEIAGVRAADGDLYVSLQTREQFMKATGVAGEILKDPGAGMTRVVLPNVSAGDYSVSVWHDINGNGQFDFGPDGRPADGWSMVNASTLRGEPDFESVKFSVPPAGARIALEMVYSD